MPRSLCLLLVFASAHFVGCAVESSEGSQPGDCQDDVDNDNDGLIDCGDEGCSAAPDCTGDDDDSTAADDDDSATGDDDDSAAGDDDDTLKACAPALSLESTSTYPLGLVVLSASGGTGAYRYSFVENNSGALLNELSGSYIAGVNTDTVDLIELLDAGCEGSTQAQIEVNPVLSVQPSHIEVLPGQAFTYQTVGGSGSYSCTLQAGSAGGSLDPSDCSYQAGGGEGSEGVLFLDLATGHEDLAWVVVHQDAAPRAVPGQLVLSAGSHQRIGMIGGSGHWEMSPDSPGVIDVNSDQITALSTGHTSVSVSDRFTGLQATLNVDVIAPQQAPLPLAGESIQEGHAVSTDVNGDGYMDVIMSSPGANYDAYRGGLAMLWLGNGDGLDASPARTFSKSGWEDQMGRGLALGDFEADGFVDLVIGSPLEDPAAGTNGGQVQVYSGGSGLLFSADPTFISAGDHSYDYYGQSVAACDINGDGYDDLIVGSYDDEDREGLTTYTNQGSIKVYLGSPSGLDSDAYQARYGMLPSATGWTPVNTIRMGYSLATGDLNNDGFCDVASGSYHYNSNDGAVFLYTGSTAGLSLEPVAAWTGASSTSNGGDHFGRHLAVGDLDGDNFDDLIVGEWGHDANGQTNAGAAWLFLGRNFGAQGPVIAFDSPDSADWSLVGANGYDYIGHELVIADMDGSPPLDLLVSGLQEEVSGGTSNTGAVQIFYGVQGGLPGTSPDLELAGQANGDWFGMYVAPLGDADGDGSHDLFVHAHRDSSLGIRIGMPNFVATGPGLSGDDDDSASGVEPIQPLDFVVSSMGQMMGTGSSFVGDVNSDGYEDLVVTAHRFDREDAPLNSGAAWLYLGSESGVEAQPALTLLNYERNSGYDEFGSGASRAGDFNGDGIDDFAISARYEDRPSNFSGNYANSGQCGDNLNNSGAIYIFLGVASGLPSTEPAFAFYGSYTNHRLELVAGDFDFNGDQYDDLVIGAPQYDGAAGSDTGSVLVVLGRPEDSNGTWLMCEGDIAMSFEGTGGGDDLGKSVASLDDLDGDGCDEFAAGAPDNDLTGFNNQGAVYLFWGAGGPGCPSQPEYSLLYPYDNNARAGYSLSSSGDVDGDGLRDLAVGGYGVQRNGDTVGAAWLATSSYLASLSSTGLSSSPTPQPLVGTGGNFTVRGSVHNGLFGRAVALVADLQVDGRAGLLVGEPAGQAAGTEQSGGAWLYEFIIDDPANYGLVADPIASFGGENFRYNSYLGGQLGGCSIDGQPYGVIGGTRADGLSTDAGAAYVVPLRR